MTQDLTCTVTHSHPDLTARVRAALPDEETVIRTTEFFRVLGDPTRLRILLALDSSEMCVCDLAEIVGMSKSAVSHQLSALRAARLVTYRRDGKNIYYRPADDHVRLIVESAYDHIKED